MQEAFALHFLQPRKETNECMSISPDQFALRSFFNCIFFQVQITAITFPLKYIKSVKLCAVLTSDTFSHLTTHTWKCVNMIIFQLSKSMNKMLQMLLMAKMCFVWKYDSFSCSHDKWITLILIMYRYTRLPFDPKRHICCFFSFWSTCNISPLWLSWRHMAVTKIYNPIIHLFFSDISWKQWEISLGCIEPKHTGGWNVSHPRKKQRSSGKWRYIWGELWWLMNH